MVDISGLEQLAHGFHTIRRSVNGDGEVVAETQVPGREPFKQLPDAVLKRRSTLVDGEGNVIQTWHIESPEAKARWNAMQEALDELRQTMPRTPWITPPSSTDDDFLVGYPVGDHHMGMLAWKYEVGQSYDLDIGERLLDQAGRHLTGAMLPATNAIVAFLGDFAHYDSMAPLTPAHGNVLDADGRAAKMVRACTRAMMRLIEQVAEKHHNVKVIIEPGNHDPFSSVWMQEAFRIKYEDNPRITIDTTPGFFHYHRFGSNLIGTNHGDKVKWDRLVMDMAQDRAKDWGEAKHRVIWTGHIHHDSRKDYPGCTVESFQVLPPDDAYAYGTGHRSVSSMKAIIFHKDFGEQARYTFNPEMFAGHA